MKDHIMPTVDSIYIKENNTLFSIPELEEKLEQLDSNQQKIVLYYIRGATIDEISHALGCTSKNTEAIIRQITEQLLETVAT